MKFFRFKLSSGFTLLFMVMISCNQTVTRHYNENGNLEIKEWYSKNHLKSHWIYLDKSEESYIYIAYYSDGRMKDSAMYVNDTVEGLRKYYEENAGLMHSEYYLHGIMNGPHKAQFSTGVTSFEGFRKNNLMVGEWKFHFINGNPITYEYYDSAGSMKYFRKYDNAGNTLMSEGSGLIRILPERFSVTTNTLLKGVIEAAVPPETETVLVIEESGGSTIANRKESRTLRVSRSNWEWNFREPGKKVLHFTLTIKDRKSGRQDVSSDNISITVLSE